MTDINCKGYTGKSSNFDLVRTVLGLKSKHKRGDSMDIQPDKPIITELQKRFRPVSIYPRLPYHASFSSRH